MSQLIYFASDIPLKEVKNPHYKQMSINEALAAGIEVPEILLQDAKTDRDAPDMLLWSDVEISVDTDKGTVDDGGHEGDFSIFPFEKGEDIYTDKPYCASLQWRYAKGRARRVIEYIRQQLEHTDEIEIWNIWLGSSYPPPRIKKTKLYIDELTELTLKEIDAPGAGEVRDVYCGHVPDEWGISGDELEQETYYCYVIMRR